MSEIVNYAKSVKKVKKIDIITRLNVINATTSELADNIDRLDNAGLSLTKDSLSWAITKGINNTISRSLPYSAETPTTAMISTGCDVLAHIVEPLLKMVRGYKDDVWDGTTISARQVYILSSIEHLEFWLNYSNKLLECLLSMNNSVDFKLDHYLTKNEMMYINGSTNTYANISINILKGTTAYLKEILAVPEIDGDDDTAIEILEATENKKFNVHRGFGLHLINPAYWYFEAMKEYDLASIRKAREDNEYLAMKINQAINQKNGNDDAALDHRINVYRDKIIKNTAKINSTVDSWR